MQLEYKTYHSLVNKRLLSFGSL